MEILQLFHPSQWKNRLLPENLFLRITRTRELVLWRKKMIFLKLAQRMTHNSLKSNKHLNKLMCRRSLSEMITYKHENYTI